MSIASSAILGYEITSHGPEVNQRATGKISAARPCFNKRQAYLTQLNWVARWKQDLLFTKGQTAIVGIVGTL